MACHPGFDTILTPDALSFVGELHRRFGARRSELLTRRQTTGAPFDFPSDTADIRRDQTWQVAAPAPGCRTGDVRSQGLRPAR